MPIAKSGFVSIGYGMRAKYVRAGNLVTFGHAESHCTGNVSGWVSVSETIPAGYRPAEQVYAQSINSSWDGEMNVHLKTDGSIRLYGIGTTNGRYFPLQVSYITLDDFPA